MYRRYKDQVNFLAIYVREAHPTDGWRVTGNDKAGISFSQPRTVEERHKVAQQCCTTLEITMPLLVDTIDDRVGHAYSGMPDRLYVIDRAGKVAYQGGRGPFGFKTGEMEQALILLLLADGAKETKTSARFPLVDQGEAWKRLPKAEKGDGKTLPIWARSLVSSLPQTTAAMLELDYLHRARSPLDPLARGKIRWATAQANGCAYMQAQAESDLARAGLEAKGFRALKGDWGKLPEEDRAILTFARKMTLAAHTVTDEEVSRLIGRHGEKQLVAMVLLARKQAQNPGSISDQDVNLLIRHFGRERALDVIWWTCRCHYMTRVADAFQLPLERENVFVGFFPAQKR